MSSDPMESFFGWLRKSAGSNDQTDVRAVLTGIEKTLKTSVASASSTSNIMAPEESDSLSKLPQQKNTREQTSDDFPADARRKLIEQLNRDRPLLPTPDVAALAIVGGYLARTVRENFECEECFALLTKPNASKPSDSLIKHQDRGGLLTCCNLLSWRPRCDSLSAPLEASRGHPRDQTKKDHSEVSVDDTQSGVTNSNRYTQSRAVSTEFELEDRRQPKG
ncbi:hypothetical protein MTO96_022788 [Rhipicephalus appendiculatus]